MLASFQTDGALETQVDTRNPNEASSDEVPNVVGRGFRQEVRVK